MKNSIRSSGSLPLAAMAIALASLTFAGCTTTGPNSQQTASQQRGNIDQSANETLNRLYKASPDSRALVQRAKGVLIFPSVARAGFILGFEHGDGVLRVNGHDEGYYTTTGGSIGWQVGIQSRAMVLLFMTDEALNKFRQSNGWTAGADATVALAKVGANGTIDTNTAQQGVVGFVLTNAGLMAGVSLDGTKIQKKNL